MIAVRLNVFYIGVRFVVELVVRSIKVEVNEIDRVVIFFNGNRESLVFKEKM